VALGSVAVTAVVSAQAAFAVSATDSFNQANGPVDANWTATSDGAMVINNNMIQGGNSGVTGEIRTAETYSSNQYTQIQVTSTPGGAQWIGTAVRAQAGGQNAYLGLYYGNYGSPELMLFKRLNGGWTQLGNTYASGTLAAGTKLTVSAAGNNISFAENGTTVISASDTTLTGGAPAIMAFGQTSAGPWAGGDVAVTTYTVGGTVSGLSGSVVLQDNGGDNLTVNGNGSFTFATPVVSGSSYSVTVLTNPNGQSCSVANGSGTVSANVTSVSVTCTTNPVYTPLATDNFNQANGPVNSNWTAISDGPMVINNKLIQGGNSGTTGEIRTAETYSSNQYSQIQVASTPTGTQWISTAVRAQAGGQNAYVGLYYANYGYPELMLFKRVGGAWTQLGSTYATGTIAAGTQLTVSAAGSNISFAENATTVISAQDASITGGAPAIMAYGQTSAGPWAGGNISLSTYTVGGTVSGLSGSVVLQDDGADNITVNANGSFTFPTPLAAGSNYSVAVASNPAGQSCLVANGAGTISANVTNVSVTCTAGSGTAATDNFNQANGPVDSNWTAISDGPMVINNKLIQGGTSGSTGEIRTAETYPSNQYSQIQVASTPAGAQWIATAVRVQAAGQNAYVGLYYGNNGSPELMLFKRLNGSWTALGSYASGALPAGTILRLTAVGNTIALLENTTVAVSATDSSLTWGAPGIMAYGQTNAGTWTGGLAGFEADYQSTDSSGIRYYSMVSANNGYGVQSLRVLQPTHPAVGVPHNFLYVLPVEAGLGTTYGDGLATLQSLDAQDQYNLTIIEPTFYIQPWYANNPTDPGLQYETFMTNELVPWVQANLATRGTEQNWLIGFSKSGLGAQDLILKHPGIFTAAASWDFPADMATYNGLGSSPAANYGTDANYQANYRLTSGFVSQYAAPFKTANRIWIGGYNLYQKDVTDYDALLTSAGVQHSYGPNQQVTPRWDGGWVPGAMAALYNESLNLPGG
jgi:hypothetical protein